MNFNFNINNRITKQFLLSKYPEEVYMEFYLGIPVKKGLFRNPLRDDNKPTCSFFRGKSGDLLFRDFSGVFNGNFIDVVKAKYNVDYQNALQIIASDFNLSPEIGATKVERRLSKNYLQRDTKIQITVKKFTDEELKWWKQYNITSTILKRYNVYSCQYVFLNGQLFNKPDFCFGYFGGIDEDKELWRIYFPKRKTYRFISNWPASKIQGIEQLPKNGKLLVITKSMKDVMTLSSFKIPAIAPNSETLFIPSSTLEELRNRFTHIVCLYDNDLAGISNMQKIKKQYPDIKYMWIPRYYKAKDISDFVKKYGNQDTINLIKSGIHKLL